MKRIILCSALFCVGLVLWKTTSSGTKVQEISYTEFISQVTQDKISKVTLVGNEAHGEYKSDKNHQFRVVVPATSREMLNALYQNKINVEFRDGQSGNWSLWSAELSPAIVLITIFVLICAALLAQLKLFSMDKTLKEILQELKQRDLRK